ncbi:hypothetical protein PYCC9005_000271 [Savitreella phatthalungensis]
MRKTELALLSLRAEREVSGTSCSDLDVSCYDWRTRGDQLPDQGRAGSTGRFVDVPMTVEAPEHLELKAGNKFDSLSCHSERNQVDVLELKDKLKTFLEQYELREQQYQATLKTRDLEAQTLYRQIELLRKTFKTESQRATILHAQVSTFGETEAELRAQLNIYVDKFRQVEDTLNNSNDLFLNFRREMEGMTRKIKKLEKENALIRSKCEVANRNILEMAEERQSHRRERDLLRSKADRLENLCRALQSRRADDAAVNGQGVGLPDVQQSANAAAELTQSITVSTNNLGERSGAADSDISVEIELDWPEKDRHDPRKRSAAGSLEDKLLRWMRKIADKDAAIHPAELLRALQDSRAAEMSNEILDLLYASTNNEHDLEADVLEPKIDMLPSMANFQDAFKRLPASGRQMLLRRVRDGPSTLSNM